MSVGWILVSFFTLLVAIAMAEIVSAIPTSGGPYFWSAMLAPPRWSPLAAWLTGWYNLLGQVSHPATFEWKVLTTVSPG